MNAEKRSKIILSVLVIIIIGVIMFYATIRPSMNEIENLNNQIASARESIDGLKGKSQLINELKKQLEEVEAEVKLYEGNMADFDDCALYLSDFQDATDGLATETSILFKGGVTSETGNYVIVQASVKFICEYDDLKTIMSTMLENKAHCYDVKITEIGAADDSDPDNPIGTQIKVEFIADYFARGGAYVPQTYDFSSGKYGLTNLFDGVAILNNATTAPTTPTNP